jgi:hypothetical protein
MSINLPIDSKKWGTESPNIQACPFCGSKRLEAHLSNYGEKYLWIECSNCGACGPDTYGIFKEAETGWNTRI